MTKHDGYWTTANYSQMFSHKQEKTLSVVACVIATEVGGGKWKGAKTGSLAPRYSVVSSE